MGVQQINQPLEGEALRAFVSALLRDLHALELMLDRGAFEADAPRIGAEQELFLVDRAWRPAPCNLEMLRLLDDPHFSPELVAFNLEINLDPLPLAGDCFARLERQILELVGKVRETGEPIGVLPVMVGILPTIRRADVEASSLTPLARYPALDEALRRLRGRPYELRIKGSDELVLKHDSVAIEGSNASFQVHLQIDPARFAPLYNIAQLVAAPVLAAATNSPLLFGRRLWRETRIALFQQAVDTRSSRHYLRERSPRVTFGTRWIDESVVELYREDAARFRAILGADGIPDPVAQLESGEAPELRALRTYNGTVYRWNRACYGVYDGRPHLRIENRVLPSGPTPVDEVANAAFWVGLMEGVPHVCPDVRSRLSFDDAKQNFIAAARLGLDAQLAWLDDRRVPAQALIIEELLPVARDGLRRRNVDGSDIDRFLGVLEERVARGWTGSRWMVASFNDQSGTHKPTQRLNNITAAIAARQKENVPVCSWGPPTESEGACWRAACLRVGDMMTTDLYTVRTDEPIALAAHLMDWKHIRNVPVEDDEGRLVGILSYRSMLRLMAGGWWSERNGARPVSEFMRRNPVSVSPATPTLSAIALMREHRVSALPVVNGDHLVGIVTERDFMEVTAQLLEAELRAEEALQAGIKTRAEASLHAKA